MNQSNIEIQDEIGKVLDQVSYACSMVYLIQEQRDFENMPKHQKIAMFALSEFLFDSVNLLEEINKKLNS